MNIEFIGFIGAYFLMLVILAIIGGEIRYRYNKKHQYDKKHDKTYWEMLVDEQRNRIEKDIEKEMAKKMQ